MSTSSPKRPPPDTARPMGQAPHDGAQHPSGHRLFPGWRWVAVAFGFPVAGLIGQAIGGRVHAVDAALVGGVLTGAGLGAVQWWAAEGALGRAAAWIIASAVGYAAGLAAGTVVFMLLSGLLLERFTLARTQVA